MLSFRKKTNKEPIPRKLKDRQRRTEGQTGGQMEGQTDPFYKTLPAETRCPKRLCKFEDERTIPY